MYYRIPVFPPVHSPNLLFPAHIYYAQTFEQAAQRYWDEFPAPDHTDEWGIQHWTVNVMGVTFTKTRATDGTETITRINPPRKGRFD